MKSTKVKHADLPGLRQEITGPKRDKNLTLEPVKPGVKTLGGDNREWQVEAYDKLKALRFAFCVAFCGSGKSILQVYLAAYDYIKSKFTQKQLLIVPQSVIAKGFIGDGQFQHIAIRLLNKNYSWDVQHNFCDSRTGVIDALTQWLTNPVSLANRKLGKGGILTGGIAIATHQAFNIAWGRLTPAQRKRALHNLTLRVDEAHHISGVFEQDEDTYTPEEKRAIEEESTHLGDVCRTILNSSDKTAKLHLTTATPYRGDCGIILSPAARELFDRGVYHLDWLRHWNTLGIENLTINYEEYAKTPFDAVIDRITKEMKERHLVIIPASGQKWRGEDTPDNPKLYNQFLRKLYKVIPKNQILDLVTSATQDSNRAKLLKEPKSATDGESRYRVVLTCMIGREGMDWVPCSRLHNTAVERSLTLAVQTSGRPLRRYLPKKTKVAIYNYIQSLVDAATDEKKRQLFSDRSNGVLLGMQWDNLTETILIPEIPKGKKVQPITPKMVGPQEVFGDQYAAMMQALIEEVSSLEELTDEGFDNAVRSVVEEFPPQVNVREEDLIDMLRTVVQRRIGRSQSASVQKKMKLHGIDIAFLREAGFDKVVAEYGINNRAWFLGEHSKEDWKEIQNIVRHQVADFEQQCKEVEAYIKRKGSAA
jgi:hypothetical protein